MLKKTLETEVRVKLPEDQREDIHHLEDLIIRTSDGTEVPLLDVAELQEEKAFRSITRRDGRRAINVWMDVQPKRAVTQVIEALRNEALPQLRNDYPGITWNFEGEKIIRCTVRGVNTTGIQADLDTRTAAAYTG